MSLFSDGLRNSNLTNLLSLDPRSREIRDTKQLLDRARAAFDGSLWAGASVLDRFLNAIVVDACEGSDADPSTSLALALYEFVEQLAAAEGVFIVPPSFEPGAITLEQGIHLRGVLARHLRFHADQTRLTDLWGNTLRSVLGALIDCLPSSVLLDISAAGAVPSEAPRLEVALVDLLENPVDVVEGMMAAFYADDCLRADLFEPLRRVFKRNLLLASGIDPDGIGPPTRPLVPPHKAKLASARALVDKYCVNTPLHALLLAPLPFAIPFPSRFEHSHVVGGSGHGKTQLLQYLIAHDLAKAKEDGRSIVVMDSQGDLIRTIAGLSYFDPDDPESLAERLLIVDPMDVEFPASLNMFDWNRGRVEALRPLDRERLLNGTIELYEYLFGALLGAELTQRQNVIFKYLARLMMEIPNSTIQTLRELMENGEKFRPYMEKLPGSARSFFETRFFERSFNETKKQILTRLWGVLSNATFERMFSHERNKVDMFEAMSEGKIILINTAKELLTHDGAAIFGRFFIALIAQAALHRSSLPSHQRNPAFVYIDEAQDYFDEKIGHLLNQARKYRVGLLLAHQNLDQLSLGLRATIMTSTSIKLAGGVSAKDARTFADDMHCDVEFLQGMKKGRERTQFACFVRNFTPRAVSVSVPLGYVEALPRLPQKSIEQLLDANRRSYCGTLAQVNHLLEAPRVPSTANVQDAEEPPRQAEARAKKTEATTPRREAIVLSSGVEVGRPSSEELKAALAEGEIIRPGKGGRQHKYLQHMTKKLAESAGFRAVIEDAILRGAGQVDVALYRGEQRIACEISVTTGSDQELRNVEKCLAAGFDTVCLIADDARHLAALRKSIAAALSPEQAERLVFCNVEDLADFFEKQQLPAAPTEQVVRGYRVRVRKGATDKGDASIRRKAIADVIARSLRKADTSKSS